MRSADNTGDFMTNEDILSLPTPVDVCAELEGNAFFTADQASYVVGEIYQPLYKAVQALSHELNCLRRSVVIKEEGEK